MPEDFSRLCEHSDDLACAKCEAVPESFWHGLDSETAQWECATCGSYNIEYNMPNCVESPDPDMIHDALAEERVFQ